MSAEVVDLFAGGLGGFTHAAHALGYSTLGIEWCKDACATREAAGLATLQADVAALDPLDFAPVIGLTGGPPCQAFSLAGKGAGRAALKVYKAAIEHMGNGRSVNLTELDAACRDQRAHLVLEPLRWALALRPRWVACEQVEPVLPLWEAMATALRGHGYWTWTGVISAEQHAVPQTRRRAFMLASLDGPVTRPPATHQRYIPPRRREEQTDGMFALPEPERIVAPEDRGLLPWISMAQALGFDGAGYRLARGEGISERHGERPDTPMSEPAPTISGKVRSASWTFRANAQANACERSADEPAPTITAGDVGRSYNQRVWVLRAGTNDNDASRPVDEPAPTLRFGARLNDVSWVQSRPAPTIVGTRRSDQGIVVGRQLPPGEGRNVGGRNWVEQRPATTVNGDPRISEPGHHDSNVSGSQQANAVRVSLSEALVLQSFDPDYPVQGSKSAQFLQVGNACPVLLALAVLRAVSNTSARAEAA